MKIRNKTLVRLAGWLASRLLGLLVRTLRFEFHSVGAVMAPAEAIPPGPRYVFALWHEYVLLPIFRFGHRDLAGLVSRHADGQILGHVLASVNMGMVAGSTNRGGVEALRQILQGRDARRHLVVTPDGPRGPRREAKPGVVYIASRAGMLLVPVGIGFRRAWRVGSWDRFAVPWPFTRARLINGLAVLVPATLRTDELDDYRDRLQTELERLNRLAEEWAETGVLDLAALTPSAPPTPQGTTEPTGPIQRGL